MGCCLTLFRLLTLLFRRRRHARIRLQPEPRPTDRLGQGPTGMLALVAGAELLMAALAVSATTPAVVTGGDHLHAAGHADHPAGHAFGGSGSSDLATQLLTPSSHLLLMVQIELLTVVVPIGLCVLVRYLRRSQAPTTAACAECPAETSAGKPSALIAGAVAALAYPAVIIGWHLPAVHALTHPGAADAPVAATIRAVSLLAVGLALWAVVLGPRPMLPARTKALVAAVALELTALPGLALLLAFTPLYGAGTGAFGLSALVDQRLAGALMMLVDLPIALVLVHRLHPAARLAPVRREHHPTGVPA